MCCVSYEGSNSFLLCVILINIIIENEAAIREAKNNMNIIFLFHKIVLDKRIISLRVLIVGGAEIFAAININQKKLMFGAIVIIPLKDKIFRDEYLKYKSFTNRNKADDVNP